MSNKIIRSLFESRLAGWAGVKGIPVAWENTQALSDPEYLRVAMIKAPTESDDLSGDHRCYQGQYQIGICIANGTGPARAETLAAELAALFPQNLRLTSGAFAVQIISPCSEGPAIQGNTHYMIPVSFGYRADTV